MPRDGEWVVNGCAFNPHHIFVFYDNAGRAVAHVEICFHCGDIESSQEKKDTETTEYYWAQGMLSDLVDELGLVSSPGENP